MGLDRDHFPDNFLDQLDGLERRVSELERFPAGVTSEVGSMASHDLDGTYHTGQISDDQAPQFIMHDGSRSYTGNQSLGDHDITNVGSISLDTIEPDAGTITMLLDNAQAGALLVWDGVDTFLTLDTTVGVERVKVGQAMMLDAALYFGSSEDTNLYRSAADTLKTFYHNERPSGHPAGVRASSLTSAAGWRAPSGPAGGRRRSSPVARRTARGRCSG